MSSRKGRFVKVQAGDIFEIPVPDGRRGYGQVIVPGTAFYVVIFQGLYSGPVDLDELLKSEILLVGWTLDALIYHGEWRVIGRRSPIVARVPFPNYKVRVEGRAHVHDFDGKNYRPATSDEWELLDFKTTRAPIGYENALLAFNGIGEWKSDYEELTVEHARRRVLAAGAKARCRH